MLRAPFSLLPLALLLAAGCGVEKAPPSVRWLTPSAAAAWTTSQDIPLRLECTDPAATQGQTGPATWQVDIGPASGGVWWSASGDLEPSEGEVTVDTIRSTWSTPADFQGMESLVSLRLTATVTDGEGQKAAAFQEATLSRPALSSGPLWSLDDNPVPQLTAWGTAPGGPWNVAAASPRHLVHLDGQDMLLIGGTALQAVPVIDGSPGPSLWSRPSPSGVLGDRVRLLRRVQPLGGAAQALVGWADRVEQLRPDGQPAATWLLLDDEVLIDAAEFESDLIALARTAQGEWRLIRYNRDNGARMDAITWTPEAPESQGPDGKGWLVAWTGDPAALEADGRLRHWFTEMNGATGLSTIPLSGEGHVLHAGMLEDGRSWVSRSQTQVITNDTEGQWLSNGEVRGFTLDRANGILWMLNGWGSVDAWQWTALDNETLTPWATDALAVTSMTWVGTVAHNRPGPP